LNLDLSIHIKIDTGMHRLGFNNLKEYKRALNEISKNKNIKLIGIFTHFASSDSDEKYLYKQFDLFKKYIKHCHSKVICHCANSFATNYSSMQLDMVRVGINLYGYQGKDLKKVMKITTKVIAVRKIKKGESVGYDRKYYAKEDEFIATAFLG